MFPFQFVSQGIDIVINKMDDDDLMEANQFLLISNILHFFKLRFEAFSPPLSDFLRFFFITEIFSCWRDKKKT